jgi:hypothetical protein
LSINVNIIPLHHLYCVAVSIIHSREKPIVFEIFSQLIANIFFSIPCTFSSKPTSDEEHNGELDADYDRIPELFKDRGVGGVNNALASNEEPPAKLREIITPPKESKDPGLASDGIPELSTKEELLVLTPRCLEQKTETCADPAVLLAGIRHLSPWPCENCRKVLHHQKCNSTLHGKIELHPCQGLADST